MKKNKFIELNKAFDKGDKNNIIYKKILLRKSNIDAVYCELDDTTTIESGECYISVKESFDEVMQLINDDDDKKDIHEENERMIDAIRSVPFGVEDLKESEPMSDKFSLYTGDYCDPTMYYNLYRCIYK